jgi:hypothetical protein
MVVFIFILFCFLSESTESRQHRLRQPAVTHSMILFLSFEENKDSTNSKRGQESDFCF